MERFHIENMHHGWWIGSFNPTAFSTTACEVAWKQHNAGEPWPKHLHQQITEINFLVRGRMTAHVQEGAISLQEGDIFVLRPGERIQPEFHTDCQLVVVKIPGIRGDKVVLKENG